MKQELTLTQVADELRIAGFTYDGARALAEYYEDLEESLGETIDFDRIAIRIEWAEYDSYSEIQEEFAGVDNWEDELYVIKHNSGWLVRNF